MAEFWESAYEDKQAMWGWGAAEISEDTARLFLELGLQEILIPGYGYGRNAQPFVDIGCNVTGIEISNTAIGLAKERYGDDIAVYHGSVADMPFDQKIYDSIFCHAVLHLLNADERKKCIQDCYAQLKTGGYMVFTLISCNTEAYGSGELVDTDTFITPHGVRIAYYREDTIHNDFAAYGLVSAQEITEPKYPAPGKPVQVFWNVICRK